MERFKSPVVLLSLGILILTLISISASWVLKTSSTPATISREVLDKEVLDKQALRNSIRKSFSAKEQKGIFAYLDLSLAESKPLPSYQYLQKSFDKMLASYKKGPGQEKKLAMDKLQAYAASLPNYSANDFAIPK